MNTTDLPPLIRDCVDSGASPIAFEEISARARMPARRVPPRHPGRLGVAAAGLLAAGIAGALVASQSGTAAVLTAATVRHIATVSAAMMTSGQAEIYWTSGGLPPVVQDISFDGADWNDVINPGAPVRIQPVKECLKLPGKPGKCTMVSGFSWTGESINRVVDGQPYHYPAFAIKPKPHVIHAWTRSNSPVAARALNIPDPRTLLGVVSPSAGFVSAGDDTIGGVRVQHLHATTPGMVAVSPLDQFIDSEPYHAQVSALDLWVDSSDVVIKAVITVSGNGADGSAQSATVTVTFSQIGQPQDITAPTQFAG
jgi:hypothetical protein